MGEKESETELRGWEKGRQTDGWIGERERERDWGRAGGSRMVRGEGRATSEQSARKIEKEEITARRSVEDDTKNDMEDDG